MYSTISRMNSAASQLSRSSSAQLLARGRGFATLAAPDAATTKSDPKPLAKPRVPHRRVFSGIQPTGNIHIGNYLGAIVNWSHLQAMEQINWRRYAAERAASGHPLSPAEAASVDTAKVLFTIVDLHSITVPQDPAVLEKNTLELAATLLACGVSPSQAALYLQSHVPGHSELAWLIQCLTPVSKLYRMTQFKDKAAKLAAAEAGAGVEGAPADPNGSEGPMGVAEATAAGADDEYAVTSLPRGVGMGLLTYPVLMTADILLYRATHIPVGDDQSQHLELCRELTRTFNSTFPARASPAASAVRKGGKLPPVFPECVGVYNRDAARVMNLRNGLSKMSKSDHSEMSRVNLTDDDKTIKQNIGRAVTGTLPLAYPYPIRIPFLYPRVPPGLCPAIHCRFPDAPSFPPLQTPSPA